MNGKYLKIFFNQTVSIVSIALVNYKGNVNIISRHFAWKDDNAQLLTVSLNLYLINNVEDNLVFLVSQVFNSDNFYLFFSGKNAKPTFVENQQLKNIRVLKLINNIIHTWWDKDVKGIFCIAGNRHCQLSSLPLTALTQT